MDHRTILNITHSVFNWHKGLKVTERGLESPRKVPRQMRITSLDLYDSIWIMIRPKLLKETYLDQDGSEFVKFT